MIVSLNTRKLGLSLLVCISLGGAGRALAHGDVTPQPVDTTGLPPVGADWLEKDPYRGNPLAVKIGHSGFAQNCARCHGIDAVSGGIAPDLRYLDKEEEGDAWFINRIRHGYTQNGTTKMPAFEGILSQEAMWAIRTYLDSRYEGN
jgi:cytochrome c-550 PedF